MTRWRDMASTLVEFDLNGTRTDITRYVLVADGRSIDGFVGRQTELSQIDPSNLTLVLKNRDGRFTPGNTSSPYYPYWTSGVQLWWSETIGARRFDFPDMWLEIPEVALTFQSGADPTVNDQILAVSGIDLLTRLNRGPRFVSTLAQYIIYNGPDRGLVAYWPLGDEDGARVAASHPVDPTYTVPSLKPTLYRLDNTFPPAPADQLVFGSLVSIPADDLTTLLSSPSVASAYSYLYGSSVLLGVAPTAISLWIYPTSAAVANTNAFDVTSGSAIRLRIYVDSTGRWAGASHSSGAAATVVSAASIALNTWQLVTLSLSGSTLSIHVNGNTDSTSTAAGVAPSGNTVKITGVPSGYIAHAQIYDTAITQATHLEQFRAGFDGLTYQRVDERIRTICNYAGIPDSQLELEESDTLMQAASLAGQRPGALASTAAVTGGGILFTRGSGLVYQDRKHRFNL